jgi:hypothetical protein
VLARITFINRAGTMNSLQTIKMYGPSISDPSRIVNRDVPACDEQAYIRAGYKRGSIDEVPEAPKPLMFATEEVSLEEPESESEPAVEAPKPRKRRVQN